MNIAIIGYGKMGKTIEQFAIDRGHKIVYKATNTWEEGNLSDADVAIEFSIPSAVINNLKTCFSLQIPVVCGTTGWLEHYEEIAEICKQKEATLLYASNFSLGVNIFFHINKILAENMKKFPEYQARIDEVHHTEKLDAPSGTAITLAEGLLPLGKKTKWALDNDTNDSLPIYAYREKDVKGTHTVTYSSEIDTISIKHEAHSRDGFAIGAVIAAEWLKDKKGVFGMNDVLQLQ